ncbi:hypothetical protein Hdeb2414_s0026g00683161 [Helianthus debilis subsp. tardiflorus]
MDKPPSPFFFGSPSEHHHHCPVLVRQLQSGRRERERESSRRERDRCRGNGPAVLVSDRRSGRLSGGPCPNSGGLRHEPPSFSDDDVAAVMVVLFRLSQNPTGLIQIWFSSGSVHSRLSLDGLIARVMLRLESRFRFGSDYVFRKRVKVSVSVWSSCQLQKRFGLTRSTQHVDSAGFQLRFGSRDFGQTVRLARSNRVNSASQLSQ